MALRPHLISFRHVKDERGNLSFTEFQKDIPFDVKRTYWISEMPEHQKRGGHAH